MYFDFRTFFRLAYLSLFRWKQTPAPFTLKRILFLSGFLPGFLLFQIFNAFCFFLDDVLYPGWKKIEIERPVFIVGNPRSGTTFIHRVMARDKEQFFCFKSWEIIFPAIVQKKILAFFGRMDHLVGDRIGGWIQGLESRWFKNFNRLHRLGLYYPEEDDKLTIHIFSSFDLIWIFPFQELVYRFSRFDQLIRPEDKKRIMTFYRNCVKRQAYFKGNKGHFLSKNPVCPPKVGSLYETFPGSRFIYMVRNPLKVIPSAISLTHEIWRATINLNRGYPFRDQVYETLKFFYEYPLERFKREPEDSYVYVRYEDLVKHPTSVIQNIYNKFGFELRSDFLSVLQEEEERAKHYQSQHVYSLDQFQLSPEEVVSDLSSIFEQFEFETSEQIDS